MSSSIMPEGRCSVCQTPTGNVCSECHNAPRYDEPLLQSLNTFFCSHSCKDLGQSQHDSKCQKLKERKTLSRIAYLLKDIYTKISLQANPWALTRATRDVEPNHITMERDQKDETAIPDRILMPFTLDTGGDQALFDTLLMRMGCTESLVYLVPFAKDLFSALSCTVDELYFQAITKYSFTLHVREGDFVEERPVSRTTPHNVYRAELANGENWIVDPTASQMGYEGPLYTWETAQMYMCGNWEQTEAIGFTNVTHLHSVVRSDKKRTIALKMEQKDIAKRLEKHTYPSIRHVYGPLAVLVTKGEAEYEEAKEEMLAVFKVCIETMMEHLYTDRRVMGRKRRVDTAIEQLAKFGQVYM